MTSGKYFNTSKSIVLVLILTYITECAERSGYKDLQSTTNGRLRNYENDFMKIIGNTRVSKPKTEEEVFLTRITTQRPLNSTALKPNSDLQYISSEEYQLKKKNSVRRLSRRLLPLVEIMWKRAMGELPERTGLERGIEKIVYTFWEPLVMLNKMAYVSWLPITAAALSLVTKNSIIAGVTFLMLIATAFQKKALLAQSSSATTRRSLTPRQPKWSHPLNDPSLRYIEELRYDNP